MMKYLCIGLPLLLISCNSGKEPEANNIVTTSSDTITTGNEMVDNGTTDPYMYLNAVSDSTIIWIGSNSESLDNKPKLELANISEKEYESYETGSAKLSKQLSQETESSFTIKIKGEEWCFKKEPNLPYGVSRAHEYWSEYIAYYPALKLHAIRSCAVSGDLHGFGSVVLVDADTGCKYEIIPNGDYCNGTPVFSPNNKYMVITDNIYDEGYLNLFQLFKVNDKNKPSELLTYFNESKPFDFEPERIIWINDNEFVVKSYFVEWIDQKEVKKYYYHKVSLLEAAQLLHEKGYDIYATGGS